MRLFNYFIVVLLLYVGIGLNQKSIGTDIIQDEFIVRVHPVGQGNCVTVKFYDKENGSPEYMIVDLGTSSIKNESLIGDVLEKEAKAAPGGGKSKKKKSENKTKKSMESESDLLDIIKGHKHSKLPVKEFKEECLEGIDKLLSLNQPRRKYVKVVVLTHRDVDHTNELVNFVRKHKYQIGNLILGGLPKKYKLDTEWLDLQLNKDLNLYIPALSFGKLEVSSWEDALQLSEKLKISNRYAPQAYSFPLGHKGDQHPRDNLGHTFEELEQVFDFGKSFKVYLLSVNPMHYPGAQLELGNDQRSTIRSHSDPNTDSLVLKIVNNHTNASVMLTGDATISTNSTIYDNYRRFLNSGEPQYSNFLETDIYLAAHHGSATHGSNEEGWLKEIIKPKTVFISNGRSQGHPYKGAYSSFKKSPHLIINTPSHKVDVAPHEGEKPHYKTRETTKAIFSTLNSGLLTARFLPKDVILISAGYDLEGSKLEIEIPTGQPIVAQVLD